MTAQPLASAVCSSTSILQRHQGVHPKTTATHMIRCRRREEAQLPLESRCQASMSNRSRASTPRPAVASGLLARSGLPPPNRPLRARLARRSASRGAPAAQRRAFRRRRHRSDQSPSGPLRLRQVVRSPPPQPRRRHAVKNPRANQVPTKWVFRLQGRDDAMVRRGLTLLGRALGLLPPPGLRGLLGLLGRNLDPRRGVDRRETRAACASSAAPCTLASY